MGFTAYGHNWGSPNIDDLSAIYLTVEVLWSAFIFYGLITLFRHRHLPGVRLRSLYLSSAAVATLYVYQAISLLIYTLNGLYTCSAGFWIMSILLPFGIGLFQTLNLRLVRTQILQQKLAERGGASQLRRRKTGISGFVDRVFTNFVVHAFRYMIYGMCLQTLVTTIIYCVSRKFHRFGIVSQYNPANEMQCRQGWEWVPSAFWQIAWTFVIGPITLWKVWNINDTHRWRSQTVWSIVASLLGSPMWLAALYSWSFSTVNLYWTLAMWFVPGIAVMQYCALILPIRHQSPSDRSSIPLLSWWKSGTDGAQGKPSIGSIESQTHPFWHSSISSTSTRKPAELYSMDALERELAGDSSGLLTFATQADFTSENILFLRRVRDWSATWEIYPNTKESKRLLFKEGVLIFVELVYMTTASFPINIDSNVYKALLGVFEEAASRFPNCPSVADSFIPQFGTNSFPQTSNSPDYKELFGNTREDPRREAIILVNAFDSSFVIPDSFDRHVYDIAVHDIKNLVLQNTWMKYVDSA